MICPKCQTENPEGSKFCSQCATPLEPSVVPEPNETPASETTSAPPVTEPTAPPTMAGASTPPPMDNVGKSPIRKGPSPWIWVLITLILVCGCGGMMLMAILFPVISQARQEAKRTFAVSQAKQVALGWVMYAADADDMAPVFRNSDDLALVMTPYLKPGSTGEVPTEVDGTPAETLVEHAAKMVWNPDMSGKSVVNMEMKSWIFFDPFAYGTKHIVAHPDASVRAYESAEYESQKAIPLMATPTN